MGDVSNSLAESWYFLQSLAWQQAPVGPDMVVCCYELYHWQGRGPTPTKVTLSLLVILVSDATNEKLQQTKHHRDPAAPSQSICRTMGPSQDHRAPEDREPCQYCFCEPLI